MLGADFENHADVEGRGMPAGGRSVQPPGSGSQDWLVGKAGWRQICSTGLHSKTFPADTPRILAQW